VAVLANGSSRCNRSHSLKLSTLPLSSTGLGPLLSFCRAAGFSCLPFSGYIMATDAFCALSGRRFH
jgi:hypothetical protein